MISLNPLIESSSETKLSWGSSKALSDVERLGHELLDLTGTGDYKLIVFAQLVHTKNGNNVLKTLVILKELLGCTSDFVVLITNHTGVKHSGGGVKRIHSGVDTKLGNSTTQHSGGIQVSKSGGGGRIGKIIGGHVHSLHRGNGSLGGRGNTFLKTSHIRGKSGLVSYSGRNTSEQSRHLRTGLGETENVVHKEQHILSLLVTEVLGNCETSQSDTGTGTRGLVHLSVHKSGLTSIGRSSLGVDLDHTSLNHLVVQIISFTGTFSNTSKDRVSSVVHGNVVNKFHDNDGLSDTSSSKETNLSSLGVGGKKIDNLDTSDKNLLRFTLFSESRGRSVKRGELFGLLVGEDGSLLVYRLSNNIDNTTKSLRSN